VARTQRRGLAMKFDVGAPRFSVNTLGWKRRISTEVHACVRVRSERRGSFKDSQHGLAPSHGRVD